MSQPIYPDKLRARELRRLSLDAMIEIIKGEHTDIRNQLILRLAGSVLPRLNEVTGEDGGAIVVEVAKEIFNKNSNGSTPDTISSSEGQTSV